MSKRGEFFAPLLSPAAGGSHDVPRAKKPGGKTPNPLPYVKLSKLGDKLRCRLAVEALEGRWVPSGDAPMLVGPGAIGDTKGDRHEWHQLKR